MALIHYWPLDETTGSEVVDVVGGHPGIVLEDTAGSTIAPALFGNGRDLSQTNTGDSGINIYYNGVEDLTYSFAEWGFSIWVQRPAASAPSYNDLLLLGNWAAGYSTIFLSIRNGSDVELDCDALGTITVPLPYPVFDDTQHLVGLTCDGIKTDILIDGEVIGTLQAAPPLELKTSKAGISATDGRYNDCLVDDFGFFDTALEPGDFQTIWNGGAGMTLADFESAYRPPEYTGPAGDAVSFSWEDAALRDYTSPAGDATNFNWQPVATTIEVALASSGMGVVQATVATLTYVTASSVATGSSTVADHSTHAVTLQSSATTAAHLAQVKVALLPKPPYPRMTRLPREPRVVKVRSTP